MNGISEFAKRFFHPEKAMEDAARAADAAKAAPPPVTPLDQVNTELAAMGPATGAETMFAGHEDGEAGDSMPMGELPREEGHRPEHRTERGLPIVGDGPPEHIEDGEKKAA